MIEPNVLVRMVELDLVGSAHALRKVHTSAKQFGNGPHIPLLVVLKVLNKHSVTHFEAKCDQVPLHFGYVVQCGRRWRWH